MTNNRKTYLKLRQTPIKEWWTNLLDFSTDRPMIEIYVVTKGTDYCKCKFCSLVA